MLPVSDVASVMLCACLVAIRKNAQTCYLRHIDVTDMAMEDAGRRDTGACLKMTQVLSRVGDKWTVLVIILLRERGYRFNELKRGIDGISQRMLTLTLRNMERDGLVTRTVTPSIPPRVDYELTDIGRSLAGPVKILGMWAFDHLERIAAAQLSYDAKVNQS